MHRHCTSTNGHTDSTTHTQTHGTRQTCDNGCNLDDAHTDKRAPARIAALAAQLTAGQPRAQLHSSASAWSCPTTPLALAGGRASRGSSRPRRRRGRHVGVRKVRAGVRLGPIIKNRTQSPPIERNTVARADTFRCRVARTSRLGIRLKGVDCRATTNQVPRVTHFDLAAEFNCELCTRVKCNTKSAGAGNIQPILVNGCRRGVIQASLVGLAQRFD